MMVCKLDHTIPDTIPQFLCRACHPELNATSDEARQFYADLRASQVVENERIRRQQETYRLRQKIASLTRHGEPEADSISAKILASHRRKLANLELGEDL